MPNPTLLTSPCGNVAVYSRDGTKVIWARAKLNGKWKRFSTKQKNPEQALKVAYDLYVREGVMNEHGQTIFNAKRDTTFAELAVEVRDKLLHGNSTQVGYAKILNKWVINNPIFDVEIYKMDTHIIRAFEEARDKDQTYTKSTINKHNICLRLVFQHAVEQKMFDEYKVPNMSVKGKGIKSKSRPPFDTKEIEELLARDEEWINSAPKNVSRYKRNVLFDYMSFIYKTGIRPGAETLQLRYGDFLPTFTKSNREVVAVNLAKSKTDQEEGRLAFIEGHGYMLELEEIKERKRQYREDYAPRKSDFVFDDMQGNVIKGMDQLFKQWIRHKDLEKNPLYKNRDRTLYSLRHTYATEHRRNGTDLEVLAKTMGTSTEMLRSYYLHFEMQEMYEQLWDASIRAADKEKFTQAVIDDSKQKTDEIVKKTFRRD